MDAVRNRLQDEWNSVRRNMPTLQNVQSATETMIEERPVVTMLIVFGLGLGVGTAVGVLLGDCMTESTSKDSSYETITQNVMDGLSRIVPDAIARQFRA